MRDLGYILVCGSWNPCRDGCEDNRCGFRCGDRLARSPLFCEGPGRCAYVGNASQLVTRTWILRRDTYSSRLLKRFFWPGAWDLATVRKTYQEVEEVESKFYSCSTPRGSHEVRNASPEKEPSERREDLPLLLEGWKEPNGK